MTEKLLNEIDDEIEIGFDKILSHSNFQSKQAQ